MNRSSMDGPSSEKSFLPWFWIIEYLTSFQQVPTGILYDLIKEAPPLSDDLKAKVDELVALRCLEELYGVGYEPSASTVELGEKVGVDLSKTCQDVLECILEEASVSDIMTRTKPLRWRLKPFILHKRSAMPKTSLQRLKDAIHDGSYPIKSSLKKMSGMLSTVDFRGVPAAAGENVVGSQHQNIGDQLGQDKSKILLPNAKKRKMDHNPVSANLADNLHEGQQTCNDLNHLTDTQLRQFLHDALVPEESAMGNVSGRPDDVEKVVSVEDNECQMSRGQMETSTEDVAVKEKSGDNANLRKNIDNGSENRNPIVMDASVLIKNAANDHLSAEPPDHNLDMGILEEKDPSSSRDLNQDEEIDITVKMSDFLTSQYPHKADSFSTDYWRQQNVCVKCNKDGQLLVCLMESCPLAVHEKCLGFSVTFDDSGNFYCPFCFYSTAVKDYRESMKEASLLKKDMAAFML